MPLQNEVTMISGWLFRSNPGHWREILVLVKQNIICVRKPTVLISQMAVQTIHVNSKATSLFQTWIPIIRFDTDCSEIIVALIKVPYKRVFLSVTQILGFFCILKTLDYGEIRTHMHFALSKTLCVHNLLYSFCANLLWIFCLNGCGLRVSYGVTAHGHDFSTEWCVVFLLQWRHNERDGVSNHQPPDCLHNCLFKAQIKDNIQVQCASLAFVRGIHQ